MGTYGDGGNAVVLRRCCAASPPDRRGPPIQCRIALDLCTLERRTTRSGWPPALVDIRACNAGGRGAPVLAIAAAIRWALVLRRRRGDGSTAWGCWMANRHRRMRAPSASWSAAVAGRFDPTLDRLRTTARRHVTGPGTSPLLGRSGQGSRQPGGDGLMARFGQRGATTYMHQPCLARNPEQACAKQSG